MPSNSQISPAKQALRRGFTLIELLIVITIIGILATMIFAGGSYAIKKARRAQAQNIAVGVASACNNFEGEYGRMPIPTGATSGDWVGDTGIALTAVLTGKDNSINRKEIDFVDGIAPSSGEPPAGGIDYITNEATPVIYDPWSNFFVVHLDGNYDKKVNNPENTTEELFNIRVSVLSKGEDNTAEGSNISGSDATLDNAKSW